MVGELNDFKFRLRVLYRLPNLNRLDLMNAWAEEKVSYQVSVGCSFMLSIPLQIRAFNLYQSPEGDRQLREQVHSRHITDEPFMDRSAERDWQDDEEGLLLNDLEDSPSKSNGQFSNNDAVDQSEMPHLQYSPVLVQSLA